LLLAEHTLLVPFSLLDADAVKEWFHTGEELLLEVFGECFGGRRSGRRYASALVARKDDELG
jgi:hypothetical protein